MNPILAAITVALWLLVALAGAATVWVDSTAINAVLGIGFWAVIATAVLVGDTIDKRRKS